MIIESMVFSYMLPILALVSISALLIIFIRPLLQRCLLHTLMVILWKGVFVAFISPFFAPLIVFACFQLHSYVQSANFDQEAASSVVYMLVCAEDPPYREEIDVDSSSHRIWIIGMWIAGTISLVFYFSIQYIRLIICLSDAKLFRGDKYNVYLKGIRREVSMYTSTHLKTPITYGILKPKIILPDGFSHIDETLAEHMILHEAQHIRHFDSLLNMMWLVLVCVNWFNPVVWFCWILIKNDIEFRCDATVVKSLGYESRADYARTLLGFTPVHNPRPVFSMSLYSSNIKARIVKIMRLRKPTMLLNVGSFVLAAVLFILIIVSVIPSIAMVQFSEAAAVTSISTECSTYAAISALYEQPDSAYTKADYAVFRLVYNVINWNNNYHLIGFLNAPPDGLVFNKTKFVLSISSNYESFFSFDCANFVISCEETSNRYQIIKKSTFETSLSSYTMDDALGLLINERSFWREQTQILF